MLLDPGFDLTLRPMKYPVFYEMYRNAIKNTWTVEEVDFSTDTADLVKRLMPFSCLEDFVFFEMNECLPVFLPTVFQKFSLIDHGLDLDVFGSVSKLRRPN